MTLSSIRVLPLLSARVVLVALLRAVTLKRLGPNVRSRFPLSSREARAAFVRDGERRRGIGAVEYIVVGEYAPSEPWMLKSRSLDDLGVISVVVSQDMDRAGAEKGGDAGDDGCG